MFGSKSYNYEHFTRDLMMKEILTDRFRAPESGDKAPNFKARTLEGEEVELSDFGDEKNVVLTFGSATCPFTAASIHGMNALVDDYKGEDVEFLFVYVREAHPGERLPAHESMEDKIAAAEKFRDDEEVEMTVVIDDLKGNIHRKYGKLPNSTFIIDKSGRVAFRCLWTQPRVVEEALQELLERQEERGVEHAIVAHGEYRKMPSTYALLHAHRALERGGQHSIDNFRQELGISGRVAVLGSRVAEPVMENPATAALAVAAAAGVITAAVLVGRALRQRMLRSRSPYDVESHLMSRRTSNNTGDYEAVGI
jgi:peroxiredoxin